jgi:uncharacterized ion transporter superfamily protein YfcC
MYSHTGANIVILNWQWSLWEGCQEVVKRSGRNEPMLVVIHMCMKAMVGICVAMSQASKNIMSFLLSIVFSLQQNWRMRRQNRFCLEAGWWGRGRGVGSRGDR